MLAKVAKGQSGREVGVQDAMATTYMQMPHAIDVCNYASKGCERSIREGGGCAGCHGKYLYAKCPTQLMCAIMLAKVAKGQSGREVGVLGATE